MSCYTWVLYLKNMLQILLLKPVNIETNGGNQKPYNKHKLCFIHKGVRNELHSKV